MFKSFHTARMTGILEALLIICLALVCARIIWVLLAPQSLIVSQNVAPSGGQALSAVPQREASDLSVLVSMNPFSLVPQDKVPGTPALSAPETSLNLTLQGVRANGEGAGVAFLRLPDNRSLRAEIGDKILDGVVLEYVFADRITLRTRGNLENLYLRKGEPATGLLAGPPEPARADQVRTVIFEDFIKNVSFVPVREGGQRTGYRLSSRGNPNTLAQSGLADNDLIQSVNDLAISDLDSEDIFDVLRESSTTVFVVARKNQTMEIPVRFSEGKTK